ncbi:MAG TPA: V-type ATP synthase subunit F [Candidatus Wujingus californicus]|uniref:V-type ATP synthase subunit F n=1 Tax=Candidatus Wujingus californicus TaxID=3367618 RepID=UPI0040255AE7
MYKIVIIGEKEDIMPYQSIGVEIASVKTVSETVTNLKKFASDPITGIILITEGVAGQCLDMINELRNKTQKAITIIPTQIGSKRMGVMELGKEVGRAVGLDMLTKTE